MWSMLPWLFVLPFREKRTLERGIYFMNKSKKATLTNDKICELQKKKLIRYSIELSFLAQLLQAEKISINEYEIVKKQLMKHYRIISDITVMAV